jgi:putative transposase
MVRYRRNRVAGGTYFFTVALRDRRDDALVRHIDLLRASWQKARSRIPHTVVAAVVLPDHLHAVIRMPETDADYSRLWQEIKKGFTRRLQNAGPSPWQSRFWEHTIRDDDDLRAHVEYVHFNPVKHGLVTRVVDWPYSSFHRYVRDGELTTDWGMGAIASPVNVGEHA